ncbi:hypothetical protein IKB17_01915 [bacterium]|nr:hypothetical protein [bacterium]
MRELGLKIIQLLKKKKFLIDFEDLIYVFGCFINKKVLLFMLILVILISACFVKLTYNEFDNITLSQEELIQIASSPISAISDKKATIAVQQGMIKAHPFLPYRDIGDDSRVSDVPTNYLVEPPETLDENSDAARVMDTIVSGILFDKYSPSAILNIEGNDYLVKKGDVVNNYKVLNILQDSVTVKLGSNVYKAGIGEILTEGTLNHNNVSNLNNKFGGVQ